MDRKHNSVRIFLTMLVRGKMLPIILCVLIVAAPTTNANAGIVEILKAAAIKVIRAVDLAIQRQQNRIIWLQNAQKTLENTLSKLRLDEIGEWTRKQRDQYAQYFDELRKVKLLITYYQRIKDISEKQVMLVREYGRVWRLITADDQFTAEEIEYMARVYTGILNETAKNVDQLAMVVNSFRLQMSDAKRLEIINQVADKVDVNLADLRSFNRENGNLRLQRVKTASEINTIKSLYGIE